MCSKVTVTRKNLDKTQNELARARVGCFECQTVGLYLVFHTSRGLVQYIDIRRGLSSESLKDWSLPVGPLVARLDGIELTEPLLIDTVDCWEWLRADADRVVRRLLMDCWLLNGRYVPPPPLPLSPMPPTGRMMPRPLPLLPPMTVDGAEIDGWCWS